jgi:hypothetical protein
MASSGASGWVVFLLPDRGMPDLTVLEVEAEWEWHRGQPGGRRLLSRPPWWFLLFSAAPLSSSLLLSVVAPFPLRPLLFSLLALDVAAAQVALLGCVAVAWTPEPFARTIG